MPLTFITCYLNLLTKKCIYVNNISIWLKWNCFLRCNGFLIFQYLLSSFPTGRLDPSPLTTGVATWLALTNRSEQKWYVFLITQSTFLTSLYCPLSKTNFPQLEAAPLVLHLLHRKMKKRKNKTMCCPTWTLAWMRNTPKVVDFQIWACLSQPHNLE